MHLTQKPSAEPTSTAEESTPIDIEQQLLLMQKELKKVSKSSQGYPDRNGMKADAWFSGLGLAIRAEKLATQLADKQQNTQQDAEHQPNQTAYLQQCLQQQAQATQIWTQAVLAVCSHYKHMVGPAMLASADIATKQDNLARAKELYHAVILDFEPWLDEVIEYELIEDDFELSQEDIIIKDSLKTAVTEYLQLNSQDSSNTSTHNNDDSDNSNNSCYTDNAHCQKILEKINLIAQTQSD